jgi:hypothetical protein
VYDTQGCSFVTSPLWPRPVVVTSALGHHRLRPTIEVPAPSFFVSMERARYSRVDDSLDTLLLSFGLKPWYFIYYTSMLFYSKAFCLRERRKRGEKWGKRAQWQGRAITFAGHPSHKQAPEKSVLCAHSSASPPTDPNPPWSSIGPELGRESLAHKHRSAFFLSIRLPPTTPIRPLRYPVERFRSK